MNRRLFLGTSARAGLVLPFARALPVLGQEQVFAHGVASGDPLTDRVLLWTRVSGSSDERVAVRWQVARDPGMQEIVSAGEATTGPERDYTFKVTAPGLKPGTTYHYRFEALGEQSPVGRTKTLPRDPDHVRLAFVSCSNLPFGYFNVYRRVAERDDLDAVLHLGDYLYEYPNRDYGDGTRFGRAPQPNKEITTLSDYRTRHAQYKSDPDLQEVHRLHPFVCVWDDHEITNNAYTDGAQNHQVEEEEGDWFVRRTAAVKAYFEWMPIREPRALAQPAHLPDLPLRQAGRPHHAGHAADRPFPAGRAGRRGGNGAPGPHPARRPAGALALRGARCRQVCGDPLAGARAAGDDGTDAGRRTETPKPRPVGRLRGEPEPDLRLPRARTDWQPGGAHRRRAPVVGDGPAAESVRRLRPRNGRRVLRRGLRHHRGVLTELEAAPAQEPRTPSPPR